MSFYIVKSGVAHDTLGYNNHRTLARKSNGDLWCTYYRSDGTRDQVYASYSGDRGKTWNEEQVSEATESYDQEHSCIAIDSDDNVHIIWTGTGWGENPTKKNIQYRKRTSSWQSQEAVTDVAYDQVRTSMAIDSGDNVHVVWQGTGWDTYPAKSQIQYRKRTTSWQTQEALTDVDYAQANPTIAIDSSDYVHVAWSGAGFGTYPIILNIEYRKRTTSWQAQEHVTDSINAQSIPSLAIDSSDYVHLVWSGLAWGVNTGVPNIQYRKRTDSWQAQEAITDSASTQDVCSVAVDVSDNVHVSWAGKGWGVNTTKVNIQYRKRTDSWQVQVGVTDETYDQIDAYVIWAFCPTVAGYKTNTARRGYAFVHEYQNAGGYSVRFHASSDFLIGSISGPFPTHFRT